MSLFTGAVHWPQAYFCSVLKSILLSHVQAKVKTETPMLYKKCSTIAPHRQWVFRAVKSHRKCSSKISTARAADNDVNVIKSASNVPTVKTAQTNELNVFDVLKYDIHYHLTNK